MQFHDGIRGLSGMKGELCLDIVSVQKNMEILDRKREVIDEDGKQDRG